MELVPAIAKSWSVSPDGLIYTFILRDDIFFHDNKCFNNGKGRKVVAGDVVFSLSRIIDKSVASPGGWIFNNRVDSIQPFTALNDSVFVLKLLKPYHPIMGILSMQYCSVVAPEAVKYYGADFRRNPVGTGPFYMVAWQEGQALVLRKNEHYFETDSMGNRLPYIDGVKISYYDSKATEFLLFRQNKLDFINDIDPSFKDEVLTKKGVLRKEWADKINLVTHPYLNIEYLGILNDAENDLLKNSPLKDVRVRKALNHAIDRKKLVLYLRNSLGYAAESGFVPNGLPSFNDTIVKGYEYNPAKAIQLLAEAGYKNGKPFMPIKLYTIPVYADIANYIAKQAGEVGIIMQLETVQKSLLLDMTSNERALCFRGSWIGDYPDAENYLQVFYSKNPAPPNYTRYNNPQYDLLLEKAIAETDDNARYRLYQQADKLLMQDAPVVPLWYDEVVRLVHKNIKGFTPNSLNLLDLRRVKIEE